MRAGASVANRAVHTCPPTRYASGTTLAPPARAGVVADGARETLRYAQRDMLQGISSKLDTTKSLRSLVSRHFVFRCEEIDLHREGLLLQLPQPLVNESLVVSCFWGHLFQCRIHSRPRRV